MKKTKLVLLLAGVLIAGTSLTAIGLNDSEKPEEFNINNYKWLAGHWTGDGFGGISDEMWSLPANGVMMGAYRHIKDGKLIFYEFLTLDETGIKLKHFEPDMKGWEEKEDFVHFELIEATPDKLSFKGLTFERKSSTEMEIALRMKRNGKIETEIFHMKRIQP